MDAKAITNFKKLAYADGDLEAAYHMPDEKQCVNCGKDKEFSLFRRNPECEDGLHSWCKRCERKYHRKYYDKVTKLKVA
jgi:hypothetical protein